MPIDPVIAEILRSQGRLEARVEMLEKAMQEMECEDEEDSGESEKPEYEIVSQGPELATNPALYSAQLDDIPPIF